MNILVTGATGFVGSALVESLVNHSPFSISVAVRDGSFPFPSAVQVFQVGDLGSDVDWSTVLQGINVVVHAAACVHIQSTKNSRSLLYQMHRVNVTGTLNLASQAQKAGVRRFIYLSTIKVNGEEMVAGTPFSADDPPAPAGSYAISKLEAEQGLQQLVRKTGLEVVIIRPPLVYGPGVKANFLAMMRWLDRGVPLPLGAIRNKRTLIALDNLVDLVTICIDHPAAADQIFLAGDDEDLSTTELLQRLANAMGKPARLFSVPTKFLELGARFLGQGATARRLCASLQIDISKTRELLDWTPPISVDEGLKRVTEMGRVDR